MIENLADTTFRNLHDAASQFRLQMIEQRATFDFASTLINPSSGQERVNYPLWFIRENTDYSGRSLEETFRGMDEGYRGWLGFKETSITRRTKIGITAAEGTIILAMREFGHTPPQGADAELMAKRRGFDGYLLPDNRSPLAKPEDLFDSEGAGPELLTDVIEGAWQRDLAIAAAKYTRDQQNALADDYLYNLAVSFTPVGSLHPGV